MLIDSPSPPPPTCSTTFITGPTLLNPDDEFRSYVQSFCRCSSFYTEYRRICRSWRQLRRTNRSLPPSRDVPVGQQFTWEASQGDDAPSRVLRPAEERARKAVPDTEVHLKAGPQEAGREVGPQGLSGKFSSAK